MHRRAIHIASLFLLLASLGTAEATTLRDGAPTFGATYIRVLIAQQEAAAAASQSTLLTTPSEDATLDIPTAARTHARAAWTMRSPNAHTVTVHAVTGSSL
jgi:hypothetical protein